MLTTFAFCALYISTFWGRAALLLPAPFNDFYMLPYRAFGTGWHDHMPIILTFQEQAALFFVLEAYIVGLLIPWFLLRRVGRSLADAGLRMPDGQGVTRGILWASTTLPAGIWLASVVDNPWGSLLFELLEAIAMIPEHFLIFGAMLMLFLSRNGGLARSIAPLSRHTCQRANSESFALPTTWFGKWAAILFAAILFGLVHVTETLGPETFISFPIGIVFAYVTVCTGSVWPAIAAHWLLNLVGMVWDLSS